MGKRLDKLREKVAETVKGEPTFDWNDTNGEARQRSVDAHKSWAGRVLPQILDLIKEA